MNWVNALAQLNNDSKSYVLLTVLSTRGSSPRDTGTKMLVSEDEVFDTIGGGALEHQCIEFARELLAKNDSTNHNKQSATQHTQTFNLDNDLKQCCGGVVSVFFEVFPRCDFSLNIFGAGHIGKALTNILGDIDCKVNLFDSRPEQLQHSFPSNVQIQSLDQPELAVESCVANSYFLVMTHDHALDQQLCEAIISRGDSCYCGVVGSRTKSIKFKQRLKKKNFSAEEIGHLTSPMGLSDLKTKKPMEVAVSIVAELLILRDKIRQNGIVIADKNKSNFDSENIINLETKES